MDLRLTAPRIAATFAVVAAFLWATYYFFVLAATPAVAPDGLVVYPFLAGGLAYLVLAVRQGHGAELVRLSRQPMAYVRIGLFASLQLSVVAGTYLLGAVDTSLLTLVGDVVLTPLLLMALLAEGRDRARSAVFALGLALSTAGAGLTIAGGGGAEPVRGFGWAVVLVVPVVVAGYFIAAAQENRRTPTAAVVAHATLGAALVSALLAPLTPGGVGGLVIVTPVDLAIVVVLGVTSFFVGPLLYFRAIELAGMVLPAVLMTLIPVFTLALSATLLGSVPPVLGIVGIPVAIVGSVLALRGEHSPWESSYRDRGGAPTVPPDVSRTR